MKEKSTIVDVEFREIAEKLLSRYPRFFHEDLDLEKFFFLRTESIKPRWISKVRKIGHPWGSLPGLEDIIYLVETASECWEPLNDAQKILVVLHELRHIPEGGCDFDSGNCGKVDEHPVQDFPECIAAANGNLFWHEAGHGDDLPNILDKSCNFDLEEALKKTGFIADETRKPIESLKDIGVDDEDEDADIAASLMSAIGDKKRHAEVEIIKKTTPDDDESVDVEEV